jgi:hypothetical protein
MQLPKRCNFIEIETMDKVQKTAFADKEKSCTCGNGNFGMAYNFDL